MERERARETERERERESERDRERERKRAKATEREREEVKQIEYKTTAQGEYHYYWRNKMNQYKNIKQRRAVNSRADRLGYRRLTTRRKSPERGM